SRRTSPFSASSFRSRRMVMSLTSKCWLSSKTVARPFSRTRLTMIRNRSSFRVIVAHLFGLRPSVVSDIPVFSGFNRLIKVRPGAPVLMSYIAQSAEALNCGGLEKSLPFVRGHSDTLFPDGSPSQKTAGPGPAGCIDLTLENREIHPGTEQHPGGLTDLAYGFARVQPRLYVVVEVGVNRKFKFEDIGPKLAEPARRFADNFGPVRGKFGAAFGNTGIQTVRDRLDEQGKIEVVARPGNILYQIFYFSCQFAGLRVIIHQQLD